MRQRQELVEAFRTFQLCGGYVRHDRHVDGAYVIEAEDFDEFISAVMDIQAERIRAQMRRDGWRKLPWPFVRKD